LKQSCRAHAPAAQLFKPSSRQVGRARVDKTESLTCQLNKQGTPWTPLA
jgi:hypothetical protein